MHDECFEPAMSQKIFSMGLDVETVSVYLLCCALADVNVSITKQALVNKWNGEPASLEDGLRELKGRSIVREADQSPSTFELLDDTHWI